MKQKNKAVVPGSSIASSDITAVLADACAAYVRARNDGGVSMADLSGIADRKIREAHAAYQELQQWGVWCECNGIMGFREAWLKKSGANGEPEIRRFSTKADAQAEAARLTRNAGGFSGSAHFRYYVRAF